MQYYCVLYCTYAHYILSHRFISSIYLLYLLLWDLMLYLNITIVHLKHVMSPRYGHHMLNYVFF